MEKEEIFLADWHRILLGNAPWDFLLEVFIRTLIIYVTLIVVMRLLGKRMNAQLTITELAVMITLGGIVSVPMQVPERGLLVGMLALVVILLLHRGLNWLAFKYERVELLSHGKIQLMVRDGRLELDEIEKARISRDQLFANLRTLGIMHLGEVKRAYFEGGGLFSVFRNPAPQPGLSILPGTDKALLEAQARAGEHAACFICGHVESKDKTGESGCCHCGGSKWTFAVKPETL